MVTGSLASGALGAPRATHDGDLVAAVSVEGAAVLEESLACAGGGVLHLEPEALAAAALTGAAVQILDLEHLDKLHLCPLTKDPWDRERFARRRRVELLGMQLGLPTPEDVILSKLRRSALAGGSSRQLRDAQQVYEVHEAVLDQAYVERWARHLGVLELLVELRRQARALRGE
jgi:hypothetical protein